MWSFLLDNVDKAAGFVNVDLPDRRRGIGRALFETLEQRAKEDGRSLMMTDTILPFDDREGHAHRRFAEACGYELSDFEVVRHLPLPVPDEQIQAWVDEAAPHHPGYRLETFVGAVPDDLVESLCLLLGQLAVDAPTGLIDFEEEAVTAQRYAEILATTAAMGRARYETVALTPDRQVVAQSTLAVPLGARSCTVSTAAAGSAWPRRRSTSAPSRPRAATSPSSRPRTVRPTATWSPSTSGWASGRSRSPPSS
jgi:hypothetical protein